MPWTEELPTGLHRACWRDQGGRKRSKAGFSQKAAAMRYAGDQESRTRRGEPGYTARSLTWGVWCDQWLPLRVVEASSTDSDLPRIERWVRPRWGTTPIGRITTEDVQAWVNDLSRQMAPASVAKVYRLLSSSLRAAVRYKALSVNPCRDIQLPHVAPSDERFLTLKEVRAVLEYMSDPYRAAVEVLVGTGMRFGELAGLHRNRINWEAQAIDVIETWDGHRIKAYPKGRRKRRVPMVSWVADAVLRIPNDGHRGCQLEHADRRRCASDLVFRGPLGAPLDGHNMLQRHWAPALVRAKLEPARLHDLRHTTASWLIQSGEPMEVIAEILGHSAATVTARYAHLAGTHLDSVRRALESAAPYAPHDLSVGA